MNRVTHHSLNAKDDMKQVVTLQICAALCRRLQRTSAVKLTQFISIHWIVLFDYIKYD